MTLPTAIASGPVEPSAVRPVRVGIGAGVLAALYLLMIYLVHPVPDRIVTLLGGPSGGVARYGGLRMRWEPPPGVDLAEIQRRFELRENRAMERREGGALVIEVPGIRKEDVDAVARQIAGGGLEMHEVVVAPEMQQLAKLLGLEMRGVEPYDLDADQWRPEDGNKTYTDYFLRAHTRDQLDAAFARAAQAGWHLPPGTHIAYEHVEPPAESKDRRDFWRSYVLADGIGVDGDAIVSAEKSFDKYTNRPVVLFELDRAGAVIFGDLTARITGHKLAIVIGDEVRSAPVINGAIRGGRASIAMGAGSPERMERDAAVLATALSAGTLPPLGHVVDVAYVAGSDHTPTIWMARLAIVLLGGGLFGLLVWGIVRTMRPVRRPSPPRADGPLPWSRILVTLLAPLAVWLIAKIPLLGIDRDALNQEFGPRTIDIFNLGMLGIMPLVTAYILVEILAMIVPPWRRRRHAGAEARRPIAHAVAGVTLALVVIQAWLVATYLQSIDAVGFGTAPRMIVVVMLGAGTAAFATIAAIIRANGLGNGYGALIAGGWLIATVRAWPSAIEIATIVVIALSVAVVLRWRITRVGEATLRVPTSGIAPLADAAGLALLASALFALRFDQVSLDLTTWAGEVDARHWAVIGLVVAMTIAWSVAFARPGKLAARLGLARPSPGSWWSATALSAALLVVIAAVAMVAPRQAVDPMTIAIVTAVVLDAFDGLRARRVTLDRAWAVHHAQHAELAARALGEAGIPCHLASSHLRTLLAFFGPFAPIDVLVPTEHVPAASTRLRELFE